jgi:hypothetical protein
MVWQSAMQQEELFVCLAAEADLAGLSWQEQQQQLS